LQFNFGINATAESGTIASQQMRLDQADVRVPDTNPQSLVPGGAAYGFLGASAGSTLWWLPQTATVGKAFFGFGTYDLDPDDWVGNATWSMVAEQGPGQVSLWQTVGFGTPVELFATSDGVTSADSFSQITGGHDHYNWGFTATGVYQVMIEALLTHVADATHGSPYVVTGTSVVTFLVGSDTAIPIPGDVNHDGIVNGQDIALSSSAWLNTGNLVPGDANGDGIVNGQDVALISANWLATFADGASDVSASVAHVPEPATAGLAVVGILVLVLRERRRPS
jgi:surface-anchored protein